MTLSASTIDVDYVLDNFIARYWNGVDSIKNWRWRGTPDNIGPFSPSHLPWCAMYFIQNCSDDLCLKSKSEYVRETKAWLNANDIPVTQWLRGLGQYASAIGQVVVTLQNKPRGQCTCGAKHTSFPNSHSTWCDSLR